jgi:putative phosphoribosyl transferase
VAQPLGAIAPGARRLLPPDRLRALEVQPWAPAFLAGCEQGDLDRLESLYRGGRMAPDVAGLTAIVVDDGLTPSLGVLAALDSVRACRAGRLIYAAPLVPDPLREELLAAGVEVVRLAGDTQERTGLEAALYGDEAPPSDHAALAVLRRAAHRVPSAWNRV